MVANLRFAVILLTSSTVFVVTIVLQLNCENSAHQSWWVLWKVHCFG